MDVVAVSPALAGCAGWEVLAEVFKVALAALVALWTCCSSTDTVFVVQFSCQVDRDAVSFSAATVRGVARDLIDFSVEVIFAILVGDFNS